MHKYKVNIHTYKWKSLKVFAATSMSERHTWIYTSKKADLVTFLLWYEPKAIYEFMKTDHLRKLIQRIYAETKVEEGAGGQSSSE